MPAAASSSQQQPAAAPARHEPPSPSRALDRRVAPPSPSCLLRPPPSPVAGPVATDELDELATFQSASRRSRQPRSPFCHAARCVPTPTASRATGRNVPVLLGQSTRSKLLNCALYMRAGARRVARLASPKLPSARRSHAHARRCSAGDCAIPLHAPSAQWTRDGARKAEFRGPNARIPASIPCQSGFRPPPPTGTSPPPLVPTTPLCRPWARSASALSCL